MKRIKRYEKEADIVRDIDDCHARFAVLMKEADDLDSLAVTEIRLATQLELVAGDNSVARQKRLQAESKIDARNEQAKEYRIKARRTRRRATRLIETRAKDLGKTLAAFQTDIMPGILGGDRSVVAVFH